MGPSAMARWVTPAPTHFISQNRDLGLSRPFLPPLPTSACPQAWEPSAALGCAEGQVKRSEFLWGRDGSNL